MQVISSQTEGSSGTTFRFYIAAKFRPSSSSPATDSISTTAAIDSSPLRRAVSPPAPALNDQHHPRMASIFSTSSIGSQPGTPTSPTPDRSGKEGDRLSILVAEGASDHLPVCSRGETVKAELTSLPSAW
jgi:hypothetical protein